MKHLLVILPLLFLGQFIYGQDTTNRSRELGLDISTPLIYFTGGTRDLEIDIIYRIVDLTKDIRFKLGFSGYNYMCTELVDIESIEYISPTEFQYYEARYNDKISAIGSFGIAKYFKRSKLPIYAGVDANIGIAPGEIESVIKVVNQGRELVTHLFKNQKNNLLILGVTPVIGIKKHFKDKFGFGLEFGVPINTIQGKLNFKYQDGNDQSISVFQLYRGGFKIINDITIFYKI